MDEFFQTPPTLLNQFDDDQILQSYLAWRMPQAIFNEIKPDLQRLGQRVITDIYALGVAAEATSPKHIPYDPWGKRVDRIEVSEAWNALDRISAEEKLIAIGYERQYGAYSRLYQFAKLYLFHPSSAIYTCPLAMTDGAARVLEIYGDSALQQRALSHLLSADPATFWTSGQWMTERTGGSDVSGTMTSAKKSREQFTLHGVKWFTSATTAQMAMTLARIEGAPEGSKGLSLFYLELRREDGSFNGIRINRLKDKLGTRALPTAELTLDGTVASLVGGEGDGVKKIASLFNITRIYNACCAVGYMRRAIALARDYATKRKAFGSLLSEHSLHVETLSAMQLEFTACFHLVFHTVELLGKEETQTATTAEIAILRLLTPLIKLYTAKQAIAVVSEALEAFGGAGYVEDTGLPRLLRDAQVLSIWEGTTNILSLDALRAIKKDNATEPFLQDIENRLSKLHSNELAESKQLVQNAIVKLKQYLQSFTQLNESEIQLGARQFAFSLARTFAAGLLLEHAEWSLQSHQDNYYAVIAKRWCGKNLTPLIAISNLHHQDSRTIALL